MSPTQTSETPIYPALLWLADISGYTRFMRRHSITTTHAHHMVARILKALVEVAQPSLRVSELEGDAVFFYELAEGEPLDKVARRVRGSISELFRAFDREIRLHQKHHVCSCEACMSVGDLRLKQVIHAGEVAIETIDRFEKLIGLDVILVHRLLKNTVTLQEYVLMTPPAYSAFGDFPCKPIQHVESYEGFGAVEALIFQRDDLKKTK